MRKLRLDNTQVECAYGKAHTAMALAGFRRGDPDVFAGHTTAAPVADGAA